MVQKDRDDDERDAIVEERLEEWWTVCVCPLSSACSWEEKIDRMGVTIKGSASKVATPNIADHFPASIVKRRVWILGSWGKHPHNGWDGNFLECNVGWQGGFSPFVQHVRHHEAAFAGMPGYVHQAVLPAYFQTTVYH